MLKNKILSAVFFVLILILNIFIVGSFNIVEIQKDPSITNYVALGADVLGAAIPGATGLGAGVRITAKNAKNAEKVLDALRGTDEAGGALRGGENAGKAGDLGGSGGSGGGSGGGNGGGEGEQQCGCPCSCVK